MKFFSNITNVLATFLFICIVASCNTSYHEILNRSQAWMLADSSFVNNPSISMEGNPTIVKDTIPYVLFNGINDGIFVDTMLLKGLSAFTVEALFYPENGGTFEQRFLHIGEMNGDRLLLEIRSNESSWYLDSFIKSGDYNKVLIDTLLVHPLNEWYRVAYVVNKGSISTYVNGKKELSAEIPIKPLMTGKTSIGVRLNKVCWFKGRIAMVRFTPKALTPNEFYKIGRLN